MATDTSYKQDAYATLLAVAVHPCISSPNISRQPSGIPIHFGEILTGRGNWLNRFFWPVAMRRGRGRRWRATLPTSPLLLLLRRGYRSSQRHPEAHANSTGSDSGICLAAVGQHQNHTQKFFLVEPRKFLNRFRRQPPANPLQSKSTRAIFILYGMIVISD